MKKRLLFMLANALVLQHAYAQHFYHRLDVGTSNLYSFVITNLATAGLNAMTDDMLFDNAYSYTHIDLKATEPVKVKNYKMTGLTARDLFNDVIAGAKLGYQSFSQGNFNWGIFASGHYKVNQFMTEINSENRGHNIRRAMLGGGAMLKFGNFESTTRIIFEAGVRYEMPLNYSGPCGEKAKDVINSGISSHYSIRINGGGWLQGFGIYADIPHYNMFKDGGGYLHQPKMKMYNFGIVYTITPWSIKEAYNR